MMKRELIALTLLLAIGLAVAGVKAKKKETAAADGDTVRLSVPALATPVTTPEQVTLTPKGAVAAHRVVEDLRHRADLKNFESLEACLDEESGCPVDEAEPMSRHLWAVQKAVEGLRAIREAYLALPSDQQLALRRDLAKLSYWALAFPDDNVREEGLRLARLTLNRDEIVTATVSALGESVSAPLYEQGLDVLKQAWTDGAEKRDVENFLVLTLDRGGFYAGEEVARKILPFLEKDNVDRFKRLARRLPPGSNEAAFLNENIREFERLQSGG